MARTKLKQTGAGPTQNIPAAPQGSEKLSERIRLLVQPFLGQARTLDAYRTLIGFACVAWNAALKDEAERPFIIDDFVQVALPKDADRKARMEFTQLVNLLVLRKLDIFPADRRPIMTYEVTETESQYHIQVSSILPVEAK